MQTESPSFNPAEDFPHNLRGYFIASLGAFSFGIGIGFFLSAIFTYLLSATPLKTVLPVARNF